MKEYFCACGEQVDELSDGEGGCETEKWTEGPPPPGVGVAALAADEKVEEGEENQEDDWLIRDLRLSVAYASPTESICDCDDEPDGTEEEDGNCVVLVVVGPGLVEPGEEGDFLGGGGADGTGAELIEHPGPVVRSDKDDLGVEGKEDRD